MTLVGTPHPASGLGLRGTDAGLLRAGAVASDPPAAPSFPQEEASR